MQRFLNRTPRHLSPFNQLFCIPLCEKWCDVPKIALFEFNFRDWRTHIYYDCDLKNWGLLIFHDQDSITSRLWKWCTYFRARWIHFFTVPQIDVYKIKKIMATVPWANLSTFNSVRVHTTCWEGDEAIYWSIFDVKSTTEHLLSAFLIISENSIS